MREKKLIQILLIVGSVGIFIPTVLFASTSSNYGIDQERGGPIDFKASSTNYKFWSEVGHPAVGQSTSTNYIFDHGAFWYEDTATTSVTVRWARPELRVGAASTNDDAYFFLTVKHAGSLIYSTDLIASTTASGTYDIPIPLGLVHPEVYDIGIKTHQTLTKILRNVHLVAGTNVLNFTQTDYTSSTMGTTTLVAGDVNGSLAATSTLGDDKINAVDLTAALAVFNATDTDGNTIREDVNQDSKVNAVDITIMLKNFNAVGDQ